MLKEEGKADRILVISPTIKSNQALLDSLGVKEEDCFDPEEKNVVSKILEIIDDERDEYVETLEAMHIFDEFKRLSYDNNMVPIVQLDPNMLVRFTDEAGQLVRPTFKYGGRPTIHLFCDDCQSTPLFRDRKFQNLCIRHRHVGGIKLNKKIDGCSGSVGVSIYMAVQNYKAANSGLPRAIRNNCTQLAVVGKSKDVQEMEDIAKSVAGEIPFEHFIKAYEFATAEPYNSLVIDLHPKKNHPSKFRKNLDTFIIPSEIDKK